ncbi:zinc transporter ZIP10-like [Gigantopelta aegis]|uniref:zinc transporter ZIP10-like n=1 Tax=Gigantopelta aegis TaxID=1735272 RepID=UPI001B88DA80|nr:zinc transporter ZIP10-like [Gigantopelta aegis]
MFQASKFSSLYVLLSVSLCVFGSRGGVAQPVTQTTSDTVVTETLTSSSPPVVTLHIHDHHGFRVTGTSSESVAREEGKYFVSLLFAKYGEDKKTVRRHELIKIFHNLGLRGDVESYGAGDLETESRIGGDGVHKQALKDYQGGANDHASADKDASSFQKKRTGNARNEGSVSRFQHLENRNLEKPEIGISKNESESESDTGRPNQELSSKSSIHMGSKNMLAQEHSSGLSRSQDVTPNIDQSDTEYQNQNSTPKPTGGRRRKGNSGRRMKTGRKQKGKKKHDAKVPKKRVQRDVSTEGTHHYHNNHIQCLTAKEILQVFDLDHKDEITLSDFLYMSPAIIYQLDFQNCSHSTRGAPRTPQDINGSATTAKSIGSIPPKVWGYSFIAVLVISLVGLLGVAIIPVMQKVFYNHLLQFLVALAVGALTGDALLHLLPHALASDKSHHNLTNIWKGLCALLGVFFFFLMERVLHIVTDMKRRKKSKYGLKVDHLPVEEVIMIGDPDKPFKSSEDEHHQSVSNGTERNKMMPQSQDHGHGHHGHSHGDGEIPDSIAAIAWMVILGDGIHNFSDGLAIGAAFANSITGGFSTSIAVFCHELPHEIGDFAMLLRTGMSVKQAIVYNVVSSVLCFIGMAIGVALGNISDASVWIFACVAGLFIYIALVDMLPEMTHVPSAGNPFCPLFLQFCGMITGSGIMLVIAVFEGDLVNALN